MAVTFNGGLAGCSVDANHNATKDAAFVDMASLSRARR